MTIEADGSIELSNIPLTIELGASLIIEAGGNMHLINNAQMANGGTVTVNGTLQFFNGAGLSNKIEEDIGTINGDGIILLDGSESGILVDDFNFYDDDDDDDDTPTNDFDGEFKYDSVSEQWIRRLILSP